MTVYAVVEKATDVEVYRYASDAPIEWDGFEFSRFDHIVCVEPIVQTPPAPRVVYEAFVFLRRFTAAERMAIRTKAKQDIIAEDFMALLDKAPQVETDDPDLIAGLTYCTACQLLAAGRMAEILGASDV